MRSGASILLLALSLAGAACGGDGREPAAPPAADRPAGADPEPVRDSAGAARELASRVAAPWPALQRRDGRFPGNVRGFTRYGESVLGYGLIAAGLRARDERMVAAGLRGVDYGVRRAPRQRAESNFENLAVTQAYLRVRRSRFARAAGFDRAMRRRWERFLRGVRLSRLPDLSFYGNHWLVEAVYVLELERTGLRSDDPAAILGGDRERALSLAAALVNERLVALMEETSVRDGGEETMLLSDPPDNPLAYHGLSLGMYARALRLLGSRATPRAREVLRRAANASWRLTAPDGDAGWFGRNQEQAFGLAFAAYGARQATRLPRTGARVDGRYEAVARRSLARFADAHAGGPYGVFIVPSLRRGPLRAAVRGLDGSAGVPSFGGLALMGLEWIAADRGGRRERAAGPLGADRDGTAVLGNGPSRLAVVRRGDLWYAVKASPDVAYRADDMRFDFGLHALKVRRGAGWRDVVPLRPLTEGRPDSAGPVLDPAGARSLPQTDELRAGRRGRVEIVGGFGAPEGARVRTGVTFRWEPRGCGLRFVFPVQAGDEIEWSAFFRGRPRARGARVADEFAVVRAAPQPASVRLERGYASASDARVTRARLRWSFDEATRVRITTCPASR